MMDYESDFDQEELDALMRAGTAPEELEALIMQMQMADQMRNRKGSQGRQAGNAYVAANPLEHIADAMQRIKGNRDYEGARGEIPGILNNVRQGRKKYFEGPQMRVMGAAADKRAMAGMINPSFDPSQMQAPQVNMPQQTAMAAAIRRKTPPRVMDPEEFMNLPGRTGATGGW